MKNVRLLATVALLSLSAAASAVASTSLVKPADLALPVPVKIVQPSRVPAEFNGVTVNVQFTLDRNGNVLNLKPVGYIPQDLAVRLLPAVSKWEFTPRFDAKGRPVQTNVVMPIQVSNAGV
jgi:hypothetical protein